MDKSNIPTRYNEGDKVVITPANLKVIGIRVKPRLLGRVSGHHRFCGYF